MATVIFLVSMVLLISLGTGPVLKTGTKRNKRDWKRLGL